MRRFVRVFRISGSHCITIPSDVVRALNIKKGDYFEMVVESDKIVLRRV